MSGDIYHSPQVGTDQAEERTYLYDSIDPLLENLGMVELDFDLTREDHLSAHIYQSKNAAGADNEYTVASINGIWHFFHPEELLRLGNGDYSRGTEELSKLVREVPVYDPTHETQALYMTARRRMQEIADSTHFLGKVARADS